MKVSLVNVLAMSNYIIGNKRERGIYCVVFISISQLGRATHFATLLSCVNILRGVHLDWIGWTTEHCSPFQRVVTTNEGWLEGPLARGNLLGICHYLCKFLNGNSHLKQSLVHTRVSPSIALLPPLLIELHLLYKGCRHSIERDKS